MRGPYNGLVTIDGRVLYANDKSLELINSNLHDVADKFIWDTGWYKDSEDQRSIIQQLIENVAHTGIPEEQRIVLNLPIGTMRFDVLVSPVYSSSGEIIVLMVEGVAANDVLNVREKEVLLWTARGKTSWEIAAILKISQRTVEWHATRAREKLSASNTMEAVAKAIKAHHIDP